MRFVSKSYDSRIELVLTEPSVSSAPLIRIFHYLYWHVEVLRYEIASSWQLPNAATYRDSFCHLLASDPYIYFPGSCGGNSGVFIGFNGVGCSFVLDSHTVSVRFVSCLPVCAYAYARVTFPPFLPPPPPTQRHHSNLFWKADERWE